MAKEKVSEGPFQGSVRGKSNKAPEIASGRRAAYGVFIVGRLRARFVTWGAVPVSRPWERLVCERLRLARRGPAHLLPGENGEGRD